MKKKEIEERRELIREMTLRGLRLREIQDILQKRFKRTISLYTIERDLKWIRDHPAPVSFELGKSLEKSLQYFELIRAELWRLSMAKGGNIRLGALRALMDLEINRLNLLQKAGYLPGDASTTINFNLTQINIGAVYQLAEQYIEVTLPYIPRDKRDEWVARVRDLLVTWDPRGGGGAITPEEVEP